MTDPNAPVSAVASPICATAAAPVYEHTTTTTTSDPPTVPVSAAAVAPVCDKVPVYKHTTTTSTSVPMGHAPVPVPVPEIRTSGKAIASMVCGIVGLLIFGIILGPIAIILGILAKKEINDKPTEVRGSCQATAGIVCGIVAVIGWAIFVVYYFS